MKLCNRADGVPGHYCIGKKIVPGQPWWHFWNEQTNAWWGAGTVYVGRLRAERMLEKLRTAKAAKGK